MKAKKFTADITVDTSEDIYVAGYYGLWSHDIEVNGAQRCFCSYVPKSYFPCCDQLLVCPPNGYTAEEFANESNWTALSEKYGFGILFMEAQDGIWSKENLQKDLDYFVAIIKALGDRTFIDFNEAALYMVAYGEGASAAQNMALNYSSVLAGFAAFGGSDVSAQYIVEAGEKLSKPFAVNVDFDLTIPGSFNKNVKLPIWIMDEDEHNETLVEYWKRANDVVDSGLSNPYGRVYEQKKLFLNESPNNKAYSRVWLGSMENVAAKYDADFNEIVWKDFFTLLRRYSSEANGAIRYAFKPEEIGLERIAIDVHGVTRYWSVFVPSSYKPDEPMPLVLAIHGHSLNSFVFAQHSEWFRIAEARGFIVAFGQGERCVMHPNCGCTYWACFENRSSEEKEIRLSPIKSQIGESHLEEELDYFRALLSDVENRYRIDKTRIYVTGHSNGGMMTGVLAEKMPEAFAAACNVGGTMLAYDSLEFMPDFKGIYIPYLGIVGEFDVLDMGQYHEGAVSYLHMLGKLKANNYNMQVADPSVRDTGSALIYSYEKGCPFSIPLVEFVFQKHFHHSMVPAYSWRIWDEFFSKFSRSEAGTIHHCGKPLQ